METNSRKQNKLMLREIVRQFPKQVRYAERISLHLQSKGVKVSEAMVYQTATGASYNSLIAWKIAVLYRALRIHDAKLGRTLKQLTAP